MGEGNVSVFGVWLGTMPCLEGTENALFGRNAYSSVVVSLMKACVRWVFVISVADRQTGLDTSLPCQ